MLNLLRKSRSVLVLGAHPDDELGCAGTILRLTEADVAVHHYYFSRCTASLEALSLPPEQLADECSHSRNVLGINASNCGHFDFPVRHFPAHRQEILEELVQLQKKIKPDLVFVPNRRDIHQDHQTICSEAIRAFKYTSLLGYELLWNMLSVEHDCLVPLEEHHVEQKLKAVECYQSQLQHHLANIEFFRSLARVRGVQAGTGLAECFEVIRVLF